MEMLVVIAIISIVAMAITHAVRGAKRTANAAKCQSNLKNLHTAVVAYFADTAHYPRASSYETFGRVREGDSVVERYTENVGWVSWVPKDKTKKRRDNSGKTPWDKNGKQSHANDFFYPCNYDEKMREAIEEGCLYKYAGKDMSTYKCPEHRVSDASKRIILAYSMNSWFISHSYLHDERESRVVDGRTINYRRSSVDFTSKDRYIPSRMALFIEMEDADKDEGREGQPAGSQQHSKVLKGDSVWEWWDKIADTPEIGRFGHRKGPIDYCNIVFLDGHVIAFPYKLEDDSDTSDWNGHSSREEAFKKMGNGSY